MKKAVSYILFSLIFLQACKEDEDRLISTDLPTEASQLFQVSEAWSEALFYSQLSFDQYSASDSIDLPGCPDILLEEKEKRVTLTFNPATSCEHSGKHVRTGKLILDFARANSVNPTWFLEYENYTFEAASIKGIRFFTKNTSGIVNETFETLTHSTSDQLTHRFSGNLNHTLTFDSGTAVKVNTKGLITGRNSAGRNFEFDFQQKRELLFSCFQENQLLPVTGEEIWKVSRNETSQVIHRLSYELKEKCEVEAYVILSDGRRLLLNP